MGRRSSKSVEGRESPALRKHQLTLYLTAREIGLVKRSAAEAGAPVAVYARTAVLHQRLRPPKLPAANVQAARELNRVGNNLNQLLVLIYQGRAPLELEQLTRDLSSTCEQLEQVLLGIVIPEPGE